MLLRKKLPIYSLLFLLCIAKSNSASAQFWKRDSRTKKVNPSNKYPLKSTAQPPKSDRKKDEKKKEQKKVREIIYPQSVKKERYRIDVLIPLYLDELVQEEKVTVKGKLPEKAQAGMNFYEGIKLAVDTLKNMGYKTDIYIHDIGSKATKLEQLLLKDSLANTDLIIGFVSSQQVDEVAKYAKQKKVNFVSSFSPSDANIKDNPYFILMNPTLQNNCEAIVKSIVSKRKNEPLFLYSRTKVALDSTASAFMKENDSLQNFTEINCNQIPDSAKLSRLFDSTKTNYILMPIMDNFYAEKLVNQLAKKFPNYRFEIFGMPTWKNITLSKKMIEFGEHIAVSTTLPYHFDATVSAGQDLANKYKATFGGRASELSFRGYETIYWMTDLVNKYGAVFNEKTDDKSMTIFTQYDIQPKWDKDNNLYYLENKHLYLYRYQAGNMMVEQ